MTTSRTRKRSRGIDPDRPIWKRIEYWIIFATVATFLSLPVIFLLSNDRSEKEALREFVAAPRSQDSDQVLRPERGRQAASERVGASLEDEGPDRVTSEEAERALVDLEDAIDRFDREVRRIEAGRERGEYHGASGDPAILLSVFAPVARILASDLERAGAVVGFGGEPDADIELTPLRAAYLEASRLPGAIERAWLSGRSLAELEAREVYSRAFAAARTWVEDR